MADNEQEEQEIDFHHPYTPYSVQLDFMRTAYSVLERGQGQVGILESPTGTGKSLSLICSALTWLRNHKRSQYETSLQSIGKGMEGEPEWMVEVALKRRREELGRKWEEREKRLNRLREKEKELERKVLAMGSGRERKRARVDYDERGADEEEEYLIGDWEDREEDENGVGEGGLSKETRMMLAKVGLGGANWMGKKDDEDEENGDEGADEVKIFYTSRTHSQLTQFISELRRPEFPLSVPATLLSSTDETKETVKEIPLSSRQKLCINPSVARLGSLSAINDSCTELQQSKSKKKCGFMPNAENIKQTHQFRDTALATVPDIEDMYRIGKEVQVCPYYASRTAIPGAEVITLPYPLLLQKSARDALGIKLEGNVVIIDEAHNIMDAVANVHAAEIRLSELRMARQMLGVYVKRFGKKLKGENRVMVAQVGKVIESLSEWLNGQLEVKGDHGIADTNSLLKARGADQINLFKLIQYIQESKLAYKVESYVSYAEEHQQDTTEPPKKSSSSSPVLHTLVSFLLALTNLSTEGRVFYEKLQPNNASQSADIKLSYLLLSPTHAFSSIASSARAVILAGGTMSPFNDYKAHLFPSLPDEKITTLSCGHVIPPSNLCVWTVASTKPSTAAGVSNDADSFEFSFSKRSNPAMIRSLGLAIINICSVVPDGVVIFFPSYGYLDEVISIWQQTPDKSSPLIWDRLALKKSVFRETKGGSSDEILAEYSSSILTPASTSKTKGAVLLSVIGGKMSEGINFSDRLGRCVIIIGLPYPNINSPEWKARIEYIEGSAGGSKEAAREFYENACMRAVNQSIGRAIRHRGDYAAIVLVDRRFGTERIKGKLPAWIRGGMVEGSECKGLGGLMGRLGLFFRGKERGL
ncbi:ATP-dependent RNA helicase chl1 [Cladorrhinum sp. PSN259]|nr:ATP-dependent RNA helicase chl1 [Cladorrhinum sp. PSN259]